MALDLLKGPTERNFAMGSIFLPQKQQREIMAKIDDVRYDVRKASARVSVGMLSLAAALGVLGFASVYRTAAQERNR